MDLLKRLTEVDSPSGNESAVCNIISEEAKRLGYDVSTDGLGSVIAHKSGAGKKLMIAAHTDEIGVIVNYIDDNGFIRFGAVGGLYKKELQKRRVRFKNGVIGIIAAEEDEIEKTPELHKLYIDIGASSRREAETMVSVGDTAVFCGPFSLQGNTVISKALDDRVGCYILLKTLARVKDS